MIRAPIYLGSDMALAASVNQNTALPVAPAPPLPVVPAPGRDEQPRNPPSPPASLNASKARRLPVAVWITTSAAFFVAGAGTGAYFASSRQAIQKQAEAPSVLQGRSFDGQKSDSPAPDATAFPASAGTFVPVAASKSLSTAESPASTASAAPGAPKKAETPPPLPQNGTEAPTSRTEVVR
jgi:hypothetical protein